MTTSGRPPESGSTESGIAKSGSTRRGSTTHARPGSIGTPTLTGGVGRGRTIVPAVGALGVVFGDIGTSPLYALTAALKPVRSETDASLVFGIVSTVVWTVVLVVCVLYVLLLLRADNKGEGGLLALFGLVKQARFGRRWLAVWMVVAVVGAATFLGDSVITPAISVLSAVEGLEVLDPRLGDLVVPVALVILATLFLVQRFGPSRLGKAFGPIMIAWFLSIGVVGAVSVAGTPAILGALSPHWVVLLFVTHPLVGVAALGGAVLAITGAEALYADLGDFGRSAIRLGWFGLVFPALVLAYLGQGAAVLRDPASASSPFYSIVPGWATLGMVILATLATIIASQAVISGGFTVVHQASRLGLLPHLYLRHTSSVRISEVYLPLVNLLFGLTVVAIVVGFRSSGALADAYGIAVTITMTATATMFLGLAVRRRRVGLSITVAILLAVVLCFLAANAPKVLTGGWLPVFIGVVLTIVMLTWSAGNRRLLSQHQSNELELGRVVAALKARGARRFPGSAIHLARRPGVAPLSLETMLDVTDTFPAQVVIVSVTTATSSRVDPSGRCAVSMLEAGFMRVDIDVGFREPIVIPHLLAEAKKIHLQLESLDLDTSYYFTSVGIPVPGGGRQSLRWPFRTLFVILNRLGADPIEVFKLPPERTIVIGRELAI